MPMETWNLLIYVMETTFTRRRNFARYAIWNNIDLSQLSVVKF